MNQTMPTLRHIEIEYFEKLLKLHSKYVGVDIHASPKLSSEGVGV